MSQFQQPGISNPEDKFVPAENNGALLLFFPTQVQQQIKTAHGEADAVHATVVRLNDGRVYENALIFPQALVTQLRGAVPDGMVLGTLGQGENKKGNPPWLLLPHTEQDVAVAERWLAANPRNQFSQPQTQAAPPAWNSQPAAAPAPAWGSQPVATPPANSAPYDPWGGVQASPPQGAWQGAAAAAPSPVAPAPAPTVTGSPAVAPGLVEALRKKGVNLPPNSTQESAEGIWALVGGNPDVA